MFGVDAAQQRGEGRLVGKGTGNGEVAVVASYEGSGGVRRLLHRPRG